MEKSNNSKLVILIVSIGALVTLIFGMSFAFFAADMSNINVTNVSVNIPQSSTMITTNATQCEITLNAMDMINSLQNENTAAASSECDLQITLTGEPGINCYYDVVLREESVANNENYVPYVPTSGLGIDYNFEFTGTINNTFSDNTGDNRFEYVSYYENDNTNIDAIGSEIQMNILTSGLYKDSNTQSNGVIARGVIGINEQGVASVHNYHFTEKWYNIPKSQEGHASKKYIYKLSAENIIC